ncbi:px domain-containing protein [Lentinula edodes]|uniref:Px domain-containing protein n=1 Tax=Lentinula edodes TaxID=5353 RepID=A0A1Q3EDT0_LENED|nr:px domain-containing protein [Lentinula edodes]
MSSVSMTDVAPPPPTRPRRPTRSAPPPPELPDVDIPRASSPEIQPEQQSSKPQPSNEILTPLRAHYLKKSLIQLEFEREIDDITTSAPNNVSTFSYLGPPFNPPPKEAPPIDLPFLRFMFRQFVLTFPFMASAPSNFYSEKLQPFLGALFSRNLTATSVFDDNHEGDSSTTSMNAVARLERNFSLFFGAATKVIEPEEVVRLNQSDLDHLEALAKKREARNLKHRDIFEVNIVSVRTVIDKGRVRSRAHEEFIIRTRRSKNPDWFVSRRYGDFRTLANELRKAHPQEDISPPPAKDRTVVNAPSSTSPMNAMFPPSASPSWDANPDTSQSYQSSNPSRLAREKNRLTLRAYIHSLLSSPTIASSPVLRSFLLSGPTTLSQEELEDAQWREEADRMREEGRKKFAREIASRVESLRGAVKDMKGDIMGQDGLTHVFAIIKKTPNVRDLPPNFRAVLEWARVSLASTVFQQLVASDNSSQTFASLKRLHGLMPYFMMKAALKISNPMGMIRSMLDLFLAQPFGGKSLAQRMFTGSLFEEVKELEDEIQAVKTKVDDPVMCEKIKNFVNAPKEIQDALKADAVAENQNLLSIVLRSGEEPVLSRAQLHRVAKASRAHAIYLKHRETLADSDDDDGPQDDDSWLYEDLKVLGQLYSRLKDREQLIDLVFEGFTSELLKDIITIFYSPLAQVYRAASIADSIGDLQVFISDLIKTVEQCEDLTQEDPNRTVQSFVDLIQRHEQSFYSFVHKVHSKGEGLFDSLMRWIELFLTFMREGLGPPISLEFLLPHMGLERTEILAEVDKVALYHYKLKLLYENKVRRRFGRTQAQGDADAEDQVTKALVDGVVGEISFGDLVQGAADDMAAEDAEEDSEDEDEDESSTEYETDSESGSDVSEASNEPPPPPPPKAVDLRRSRTAATQTPPPPRPMNARSGSRPPDIRRSRQEPSPLKSSRSMTSMDYQRQRGHAPPVPPLPRNAHLVALSKPLPPSPAPSSERFGSPSRASVESKPHPEKTKKSRPKGKQIIKPPELTRIPTLLPIFREMIRPLLRPRQRTHTSNTPTPNP